MTKNGRDVCLYVDGDEVAYGIIDNCVGGNDVGLDFYAARFRTPPGSHDWFWHGSLKNVNICDAALDRDDIFSTCALTISASVLDTRTILNCRCVSGEDFSLEFGPFATLADLRAELDVRYQGVPVVVLVST